MGHIIVVHPGHPLVGHSLPVVRRYREHGQRLWVIELPDGTRQYLPAAWCTPLVPLGSTAMVGVHPPVSEPPPEPPSPLSLAGLRELAALVRRVRSEEHTSELQSRTVISYAVFCLKKKKEIHLISLVCVLLCLLTPVAC